MRSKRVLVFLFVLALAPVAGAQTKIFGTEQCARVEPQYRIEVGDRPNHSLLLGQWKCTWTKPLEIEGIQSKEGVATGFDDVIGNSSRYRGYYVETMANRDKGVFRYQGTATLKEGVFQSNEHKWSLVRGTGKLKGIKGQGTCKGKGNPDGSVTLECEGEYQLPK